MGSRATPASALRSSACAAAASSTSARTAGTSSTRYSTSGCGARRRWPIGPHCRQTTPECSVPPKRYTLVLLPGTSRLELCRERDDLAAEGTEVLEVRHLRHDPVQLLDPERCQPP